MAVVKKNVILMPARPTVTAARMSERKWGREVMEARNFCILPSLLLAGALGSPSLWMPSLSNSWRARGEHART